MKNLALSFLLLAAFASPTLAAAQKPAAAPASPSFGEIVEVNVVNVDVYVTDRDGKRVEGLKKGDFTVLEDGKPVEVTNFTAVGSGSDADAGTVTIAAGSEAGAPAVTANPNTWLNLVVFVDNLHLRPENRTRALGQLRKFLAETLRPEDRVMLATYDLGLKIRQPFTGDPAAVEAGLRQIETLPTFGIQSEQSRRSAFRTLMTFHQLTPCSYEIVSPVESYASEAQDQVLRTLGALTVTVNSLAGIPGRKALLYISDGLPVTPGEELYQVVYELCSGGAAQAGVGSTGAIDRGGLGAGEQAPTYPASQALLDAQKFSLAKKFEDLTSHANANRVTFYTLQASGLRGFAAASADTDLDERVLNLMTVQQAQTTNYQNSLNVMASNTGGRAILNANDFLPDLGRMHEDFSSYYSLGYTPSHAGDGRQHRTEVKVKKPGMRVRYRQSYRDKPVLERIVDRTLASLLHGIQENPLEIIVQLGDQTRGEDGKFIVPIQLKIPIFKLALISQDQAVYRGKLRLMVVTRDAKGGTSPVRQVEVPLEIPRKEMLNATGRYYQYSLTLKMEPGEQTVAVAVRDELSAATSYLSRSVSVGSQASNGR